MKIQLFVPGKQPMTVNSPQFGATVTGGQISPKLYRIAQLLRCRPTWVDVLAQGEGFGMYSVFDAKGPINTLAMVEFSRLTGVAIDPDEEHDQLRGPVLVLTICD